MPKSRQFARTAVAFMFAAVLIAGATPARAQQFSEWSAPVNLGPIVNSGVEDGAPCISRDGLRLYFNSTRSGNSDLYVTHRTSLETAWAEPVKLPNVNTSYAENACALSTDEHRLYFQSNRPGGQGGIDLYVSRRPGNKADDSTWEPPINLGSPVNTGDNEFFVGYFEDDVTGIVTLFFSRMVAGTPNGQDIYASTLLSDDTWSTAMFMTELNTNYGDMQPSVRRDGLELFFTSNRPGSIGLYDIWVATRATTTDGWSSPVNIGSTVNCTGCNQGHPSISADGTALYFYSNRPGGSGGLDLWVTTRTNLKGNKTE